MVETTIVYRNEVILPFFFFFIYLTHQNKVTLVNRKSNTPSNFGMQRNSRVLSSRF